MPGECTIMDALLARVPSASVLKLPVELFIACPVLVSEDLAAIRLAKNAAANIHPIVTFAFLDLPRQKKRSIGIPLLAKRLNEKGAHGVGRYTNM